MGERDLKWFLLLPYKASFRPPFCWGRAPVRAWARGLRKWRWLWSVSRNGASVHRSVELRGRTNFPRCLNLGDGCVIERDCTFWLSEDRAAHPLIKLGANVYVGRNCYLGAYEPLEIGADSLVGAYSYIITGDHRFDDPSRPVREQGYRGAPVVIGRDVWLGCHVTVLPGVTIGDHAVIGAGAVVTKSIPAREVWGGVPAVKISTRI